MRLSRYLTQTSRVHENIAAFGGDPNHISAIGQSFGATATYHIVNSNITADLGIVNAISESGVRSPNDPQVPQYGCGYVNETAAQTEAASILAGVNATTITEARALNYSTIWIICIQVSRSLPCW